MARFAGERLRQLRELNGMTQEEVAKRMPKASRSLVGLWETGGAIPDTAEILLLADLFKVPVGVFFEGGEAEPDEEVKELVALWRYCPKERRSLLRAVAKAIVQASSFNRPDEEVAMLPAAS